MEIHQMQCHKRPWRLAETRIQRNLSSLKHGQTQPKSSFFIIFGYLSGYGERLVASRATKNQMLQKDSAFELHEIACQNICTEQGVENSFVENRFEGKPGARNVATQNE